MPTDSYEFNGAGPYSFKDCTIEQQRERCKRSKLPYVSKQEVNGVLAHEIGHHKHHDSYRRLFGLFMGYASASAVFDAIFNIPYTVDAVWDIKSWTATLSFIPMGLFGIIPLYQHYSRMREYSADRYAVEKGYNKELAEFLSNTKLAYGHDIKGLKGYIAQIFGIINYDGVLSMREHPYIGNRLLAIDVYRKELDAPANLILTQACIDSVQLTVKSMLREHLYHFGYSI